MPVPEQREPQGRMEREGQARPEGQAAPEGQQEHKGRAEPDGQAEAVAQIMRKVCGFPPEGQESDLDPEYAVFGRSNEVLQRGIADHYAAKEAASTWRTVYYRPAAWSGELCSDYRDHPREICGELHDLA